MMDNPVNALWMINPEMLEDLVGFKIETYYTQNNQSHHKREYVFWQKGTGYTEQEKANSFLNGNTKVLNYDKLNKKAFLLIAGIRKRSKND